jgi:LSD1 subclass zinc finger protein
MVPGRAAVLQPVADIAASRAKTDKIAPAVRCNGCTPLHLPLGTHKVKHQCEQRARVFGGSTPLPTPIQKVLK